MARYRIIILNDIVDDVEDMEEAAIDIADNPMWYFQLEEIDEDEE